MDLGATHFQSTTDPIWAISPLRWWFKIWDLSEKTCSLAAAMKPKVGQIKTASFSGDAHLAYGSITP